MVQPPAPEGFEPPEATAGIPQPTAPRDDCLCIALHKPYNTACAYPGHAATAAAQIKLSVSPDKVRELTERVILLEGAIKQANTEAKAAMDYAQKLADDISLLHHKLEYHHH